MIKILLWVCGGFLTWMVIGAGVMASMPNQEALHEWSDREPIPGLTLFLWPVWVYYYRKSK